MSTELIEFFKFRSVWNYFFNSVIDAFDVFHSSIALLMYYWCIAFLDEFISGINNQNLTLQTYHKSIYTGLHSNFKSFTSFSWKISLIKCLIDRSFKICNNWNSFHNDKENIKSNLIKNAYPSFFINKIIKKYVDYKFSSNWNQSKDKSHVHYIKLQYIGNPSHHIKINLSKLCNDFCKENFNIKLVFNSFRFESYCWYKFLMIWNFSSI